MSVASPVRGSVFSAGLEPEPSTRCRFEHDAAVVFPQDATSATVHNKTLWNIIEHCREYLGDVFKDVHVGGLARQRVGVQLRVEGDRRRAQERKNLQRFMSAILHLQRFMSASFHLRCFMPATLHVNSSSATLHGSIQQHVSRTSAVNSSSATLHDSNASCQFLICNASCQQEAACQPQPFTCNASRQHLRFQVSPG